LIIGVTLILKLADTIQRSVRTHEQVWTEVVTHPYQALDRCE
jgi:hypothetical protein